ncbi:ChbG/HpnK family deacetylase [Synechococcus sp. HK05]|uniref:ChbG/HpnK family deacetylase n=1 Tax=Synechococcus sp. HK05 TaxID=2725975 RepID=UPI0020CAD7E4|nr:ChbG/HpnK family deacetylase [Synechococcus sp. HK05]
MAVGVRAKLAELMRYGGVGVLAAAIHALVLLSGERLGAPLPLANLLGFLLASVWGYLAHALFTFREHTGGSTFPRRWLLIQTSLNILVSLLLPGWLGGWARSAGGTLVLVFTPTAINYVLWSLAARHSRARRARQAAAGPIRFHADDLGLHPAVNATLLELCDAGALDSASVLVAAPAAAAAAEACAHRPNFELALHLCLSEGPPAADPARIPELLDDQGRLALGFGRLLLLGCLPPWWPPRQRVEAQLAQELEAQIRRFQELFPTRPLRLDGHQHVHLTPLVWGQLRQLPPALQPSWIRSLREPWPWRGIPLALWWQGCLGLGPIKWLLLRLLNRGRAAELARRGIATNAGFCGVLFTGRIDAVVVAAAQRQLRPSGGLVLAHPARGLLADAPELQAYPLSRRFYASPWRAREAEVLMRRTR